MNTLTDEEKAERRREQKRISAQKRRDRQGRKRPKAEITYEQAGVVIGVSRQRIDQLVKRGELPKPLTRAAVEAYAVAHRARESAERSDA